MSEIFAITKAKEDDMLDVFYLANDLAVREASFNKEEISLENHRNWFLQAINDANCFFYILRNRNNADFIGSVRFNLIAEDALLIGIQISQNYRGKGIAQGVIDGCINRLGSERVVKNLNKIIAHIKKTNIASRKSFLKSGFQQVGVGIKNGNEYDILERNL